MDWSERWGKTNQYISNSYYRNDVQEYNPNYGENLVQG